MSDLNQPAASSPPPPTMPDPEDAADDAVIGRAFRRSLLVILAIAALVAAAVWWQRRGEKPSEIRQSESTPAAARVVDRSAIEPVAFKNIAAEAGIAFTHVNGAKGEKLLPETMGGGCAFFDYDNDGDQDLLLVNSCYWPWDESAKSATPPTAALYRNDGNGKFADISAESGLAVTCYGMGVTVGDYDNDGFVDVYLSAVGLNHLFRNLGNGRFEDVTKAAGVAGADDAWSTSCGFFDYDNDGDLDLFVCNYVAWSREIDLAQSFKLTGIGRAYGPPLSFAGSQPVLFRNDGNGKFSDVSAAAGVRVVNRATGVPVGKSLGLTFADVDRDGWIDVFVANDTVQNFLFHNQHNGTFVECGATASIGFDSSGNARGAMGIDAARYRGDDALGVAIGNFANEMSALFVAPKPALAFTDEAVATGFGPPTRLDLSFGTFFFDYDLDGRLDVLSANGHLEEEIEKVQSSQRYRQSARLFWNAGAASATELVSVDKSAAGADLFEPIVGRGAAYADIDGDGDLDVVLTQIAGRPLLLRNDQQLGRHWLRFKLVGTKSNRDAIGAWIEVRRGGRTYAHQVMPTRSYLSQVELPVTVGLGKSPMVESVRVVWPDGTKQDVPKWNLDGTTTVREGE